MGEADNPQVNRTDPRRRLILSYAREEDYLPLTRAVLSKMGYAIVTEEERPSLPPHLVDRSPELIIVDERRLSEIEDEPDALVPLIVLSGSGGVTGADPRVLGAVCRPAGLHELYRLIQQGLEERPRSAPRVATNLTAHCRQGEHEWRASLLSLSENGCLMRTPEPLELGSQIEIRFELPQGATVETQAEAAYQIVPDLGLVFSRTPAVFREAIASFVERTLVITPP